MASLNKGGNIKEKLNKLEGMLRGISEEVNFHKKESQLLRGEKDSLENILSLKAGEIRKTLTNETSRVEEELKRQLA
eukprot:CAMPEP_0170546180 /NCGR_PEP_ID=MMETSP0211-20121228/4560_1 /TAXON_ID=311385 /ORGANISM="Pseudokeronopsis sp., Strain OXSARD2" /LENGTH=76 /DNA_ID=CAMNT_0010850519 /DNA_START=31 /DNA_END=261 /DNA_ORIENTATION=+